MVVLPSFVTLLTIFRTCFHKLYYLHVNQLTELVRNENLFKTDKLKSGLKPSIRRTGAELFDFLVFRKYFGQKIVTQTKE
jgi:hypothetical protein